MKFRDKYWFLSNMYPCEILHKRSGIVFPCVESAFQAGKAMFSSTHKIDLSFARMDGFTAKKEGRKVKMDARGWNDAKQEYMRRILRIKFRAPELKALLLATPELIVEDNDWGDTYWGTCNGMGKNKLGELLMIVRAELQNS